MNLCRTIGRGATTIACSTARTSLHLIAVAANVAGTTTAVVGATVSAFMLFDSMSFSAQNSGKKPFRWNLLNPCNSLYPTFLNFHILLKGPSVTCEQVKINDNEIQNLFNSQILLLPFVGIGSLCLSHAFYEIKDSAKGLARRI